MSQLLRIEKVSFKKGGQTLLKDCSVTFDKGSHTVITGLSGGVKSTLLKLWAFLLTPTTGAILFNKQSLKNLEIKSYRQQVSYCFQQPTLFGQTVCDNLLFLYNIRIKHLMCLMW